MCYFKMLSAEITERAKRLKFPIFSKHNKLHKRCYFCRLFRAALHQCLCYEYQCECSLMRSHIMGSHQTTFTDAILMATRIFGARKFF